MINNWEEAKLLKPSVIKPILITFEKKPILKIWRHLSNKDKNILNKNIFELLGQI